MILGHRHATRLKPTIQYFLDSLVGLSILRKCDIVDVRPVQVIELGARTGQLFQLVTARNNHKVSLVGLVHPDRHRGTPVTIAANGPIPSALQPLTEPAFLDVAGTPADVLGSF